jgi:hypothetical protein
MTNVNQGTIKCQKKPKKLNKQNYLMKKKENKKKKTYSVL